MRVFIYLIIGLLTSCISKIAEHSPKTEPIIVTVDTPLFDKGSGSQFTSSNIENNWLVGKWEVETDFGLATLTILDSENAISQGERGTYTIENGLLGVHSNGICTTYNLNYSDHSIELGGGYTLRKIKDKEIIANENDDCQQGIFTCQNAVSEFLSMNKFTTTNGNIFNYQIGELSIKTNKKILKYTDIEISIESQNKAILTAIEQGNSKSIKFTINGKDRTIIDCNDSKIVFYLNN